MAIIERRGSLVFMQGENIPSLILAMLGMKREMIIERRVYVFNRDEMTLSLCPEWFLERCK